MRYSKETPRIIIKIIDSKTENTICEIKDRNFLNVGEIFPDSTVTGIVERELKGKKLPKNIMVLAVAEYNLLEEED